MQHEIRVKQRRRATSCRVCVPQMDPEFNCRGEKHNTVLLHCTDPLLFSRITHTLGGGSTGSFSTAEEKKNKRNIQSPARVAPRLNSSHAKKIKIIIIIIIMIIIILISWFWYFLGFDMSSIGLRYGV